MEKRQIESLITQLDCDNAIACQKARRALVAMGDRAVPALIKALGSKRDWVRWEAAKALSQIGDPLATDALIKALEDKNFDVRWLAAEGLISIGRKSVIPLLRALIENPKSIWLREGAHHVLHDMVRGSWHDILKPVMVAIEAGEPDLEVPPAAKKALDELEKQTRAASRTSENEYVKME